MPYRRKMKQNMAICPAKTRIRITCPCVLIVRLSLLRKTILKPEYKAFMCVFVFVDGCISQF